MKSHKKAKTVSKQTTLLFLVILCFCLPFINSCGLFFPADPPKCDDITASLSLVNPPASAPVGNVRYNVDFTFCVDYQGGQFWLAVQRPNGSYDFAQPFSINSVTGDDYEGTHSFEYYFPTSGVYTVWAKASKKGSSNGPGTEGDVTTSAATINITSSSNREFKVIQLQMVNDNLWPNDLSNNNNYVGTQKRDNAFQPANVNIRVISNKTGLSNTVDPDGNPINFSIQENLYQWAAKHAYGLQMQGVDPKVTLLCGIDDVPLSFQPNPPNGFIGGFMFQPDAQHTVPPVCFILYSRINSFYSATYDRVREINGAAIHELGHAVGIAGDDPNISPPHSGTNSSTCLMISPAPLSVFTNPVFCGGHIQFISNQTWFQ